MHRTEERCREHSHAFPGAAVPKDHKLGSLKWQTCIILLQSGGQKPEIKASAGLAPSETPRENMPRPVPQLLVPAGAWASLGLRTHHPISASILTCPSSGSLYPLLSLIKTRVMGFKAHSNPG